jgi:Flp pilus assembly protein TadG
MARGRLSPTSVVRRARERGQSATEFVIVLPVLLLIILATLQLGLLYRAKSTLNLATFQAARTGALHYGREDDMQAELVNGLAGLYAHGTSWNDLMAGRQRAGDVVSRYARLTVLNPPAALRSGRISNLRLKYQNATQAGLSVQDLNLLKIKVVYCHPLQVPFIATTLKTLLMSQYSGFEQQCLTAGRLPLASSAVVRMQTDYCPQRCP